jgi:hypothetical protein
MSITKIPAIPELKAFLETKLTDDSFEISLNPFDLDSYRPVSQIHNRPHPQKKVPLDGYAKTTLMEEMYAYQCVWQRVRDIGEKTCAQLLAGRDGVTWVIIRQYYVQTPKEGLPVECKMLYVWDVSLNS